MALTYEEGQWIRDNNDVEESESKRMREVTKAKKEMMIVRKSHNYGENNLISMLVKDIWRKGGTSLILDRRLNPFKKNVNKTS